MDALYRYLYSFDPKKNVLTKDYHKFLEDNWPNGRKLVDYFYFRNRCIKLFRKVNVGIECARQLKGLRKFIGYESHGSIDEDSFFTSYKIPQYKTIASKQYFIEGVGKELLEKGLKIGFQKLKKIILYEEFYRANLRGAGDVHKYINNLTLELV